MPLYDLARICKYFIHIGSQMEAKNCDALTPLLYAAWSILTIPRWPQVLIANGADVTARDDNGRGLFHQLFLGFTGHEYWPYVYTTAFPSLLFETLTYFYKGFEDKARIFLEAGCNPYIPDLNGHTPACYARDKRCLELWQSILGEWEGKDQISNEYHCGCGGLYVLEDVSKYLSRGNVCSEDEYSEVYETFE